MVSYIQDKRYTVVLRSQLTLSACYNESCNREGFSLNNDNHTSNHSYDQIYLREIIRVIWEGKFKIIVITALFSITSVLYALSLPNLYKATAIFATSEAGISNNLSQLGGLASLAGVGLGGSQSGSEEGLAKEIMQSWSFIERFVLENDLAPMLNAVDSWNEETDQMVFNENVYDYRNKSWMPDVTPPTSWDLFESFSGRLSVEDDRTNGLTRVTIEYFSPKIAKAWLDLYVSSINVYMQQRRIKIISKQIEYLEVQILETPIAEVRKVLFNIISEQIRAKMMAQANPDFVFVAVSPSMIPEKKSQPKRALICVIGTLIGGISAVLLVLMLHYSGIKSTDNRFS